MYRETVILFYNILNLIYATYLWENHRGMHSPDALLVFTDGLHRL